MAEDDPGPAAVDSIWWYAVAFVVVWGVLAWVVLLRYLATPPSSGPALELTAITIAVLLVHPIALYLDMGAIERSGVDWSPNARLYLAGSLLGVPATVFSSFMAVLYLYQRHRHVGIP